MGELKINVVIRFCLALQAQLDELKAAYKKAHKVELADEIDKKCNGDLKALILAKLGKGEGTILELVNCCNHTNVLGSFAESDKCRTIIKEISSGDMMYILFKKVTKTV